MITLPMTFESRKYDKGNSIAHAFSRESRAREGSQACSTPAEWTFPIGRIVPPRELDAFLFVRPALHCWVHVSLEEAVALADHLHHRLIRRTERHELLV